MSDEPFGLGQLTALMERTSGSPEVKIGLIDGPVVTQHPDLAGEHLHEIPGNNGAACTQADSTACLHGTFVVGILSARREFSRTRHLPRLHAPHPSHFRRNDHGQRPDAERDASAACRGDHRMYRRRRARDQPEPCAGAAFQQRRTGLGRGAQSGARRGVIVVAAAGNQGTLGSSAITRHPWVIPVVACDRRGRPMSESNLGSSIGRRGLTAPGDAITSLSRRRTTAHARRNERCGAFCDRDDRTAVVGISRRDGGANQARRFSGVRTAARLGGSALAGRRGGLSKPATANARM